MRTLRNEKGVSDRGAQKVFCHQGFRVVVNPIQQHLADGSRVHNHVPTLAHFARDHRLFDSYFRNNAEHITSRHSEAAKQA